MCDDNLIFNKLQEHIENLENNNNAGIDLIQNFQYGVFVTDNKGKIIFVNDIYLEIIENKRENIFNKSVFELSSDNILSILYCRRVIQTKSDIFTVYNYRNSKRCLIECMAVKDNNRLLGVINIVKDVSRPSYLINRFIYFNYLSTMSRYKIEQTKENKKTFISRNHYMNEIYHSAEELFKINNIILLSGEKGVGKEFFARHLYCMYKINLTGKFVKVNCCGMDEGMFDEYFSINTSSVSIKKDKDKEIYTNYFEEANNGVLYIKNIDCLPHSCQKKFLSIIDSSYVREGKINTKIIVSTNKDLKELVDNVEFYYKLYDRLCIANFIIPPLRDRREDIIPLCNEFIKFYNKKFKKTTHFSNECLQCVVNYDWRENISELKILIMNLVLLTDNECIDKDLFFCLLIIGRNVHKEEKTNYSSNSSLSLKKRMEDFESNELRIVLSECKTLKQAASELDVDISTLVRKKQKYKIK